MGAAPVFVGGSPDPSSEGRLLPPNLGVCPFARRTSRTSDDRSEKIDLYQEYSETSSFGGRSTLSSGLVMRSRPPSPKKRASPILGSPGLGRSAPFMKKRMLPKSCLLNAR